MNWVIESDVPGSMARRWAAICCAACGLWLLKLSGLIFSGYWPSRVTVDFGEQDKPEGHDP